MAADQSLARSQVVRWDELDPDTYELMVSVLLSRLHPYARRTDGAGGDGGKDVWWPTPKGPEIFELKSFTGRLDTKRRPQVKSSLGRAAPLGPVAWHLVVPIDPTPGEEEWFANLTVGLPFPCDWLGLTWLNEKMAAHRDVARYFALGGSDEVIRALERLQQEAAALANGVPDAVTRMSGLMEQCDELDPYYRVGLAFDGTGRCIVSLTPKYAGADKERPITITPTFKYPDNPVGHKALTELQEAFTYGTPIEIDSAFVADVEIDAPAGLGGSHGPGTLVFGAALIPGEASFQLGFGVTAPDGSVLGSVSLEITERTAGPGGGLRMQAQDPSGALSATLMLLPAEGRYRLHFETTQPHGCLPATLPPTLRVLGHLHKPNAVVVLGPGGLPLASPSPLESEDSPTDSGYSRIVEAIDRVQRHSGVSFPLPDPDRFTLEDGEALTLADTLIKGEAVAGVWEQETVTVSGAKARELLDHFDPALAGSPVHTWIVQDLTISLFGWQVPIGKVTRHCLDVVVDDDARQCVLLAHKDDEVELRFVPGKTDRFESTLGDAAFHVESDPG